MPRYGAPSRCAALRNVRWYPGLAAPLSVVLPMAAQWTGANANLIVLFPTAPLLVAGLVAGWVYGFVSGVPNGAVHSPVQAPDRSDLARWKKSGSQGFKT